MKARVNITILIFVGILQIAQSQTFSKEFGKISKDEIEFKQYPFDSDAEAIVLFDIGKSYFVESENSFDIVFERTTSIKILSDAGIKWAEVNIPFYQEGGIFEKVYDVEAYSYNYENGLINKTKLNQSNIFDEKINNFWNVKKFAVPNVKEGTIIQYKYKINSQYKFNLRDWEFQWRIPVVYSEYEVKMIPFYEYSWLLQGANKFDFQTSHVDKGLSRQFGPITFQDMVHKYVMKNLPAFNSEEYITSINDYIIKLDFQLSKFNHPTGGSKSIITTWEDLNKELLQHKDFGKYIEKSEKLSAKLLSNEILEHDTDKEKFNKVMNFVKANYNWNRSNSKYASKTPSKFIEEKLGNCADINLFAIGALNASGIVAKPLLISTRGNGKIKSNYPYAHFFNYVIILANVDGENILTDATEILSLNDRIPTRCINDKGLVIQKGIVEWIGLECMFPSEISTDLQIEFDNKTIINSTITKSATEYEALYYRNYYSDNIKVVRERLEKYGYTINDTSINVQNQLIKENPYVLNFSLSINSEIVNDKIYLSPFLNETATDNPLKQKDRNYPIDMTFPTRKIYKSTIHIPNGYEVDYLPSGQKINNQLFELTYDACIVENQIIVSFEYYFKKSLYSASDYNNIKFYINEIVKKGNEKLVFSKML